MQLENVAEFLALLFSPLSVGYVFVNIVQWGATI